MAKIKDKKIMNYYSNELLLCQKNWKICKKQWEFIKGEYEYNSMKNDIAELKTCLDDIVNLKNQQLTLLFQGLVDVKEQTDFLVAVKISAFDKFIDLYKSRYNFYNRRHLLQTFEIKNNSRREENELTELFEKSKEKLNFLLSCQVDHNNESFKSLRNKKKEAIFEQDSENAAEMEKLEHELQSHMEWVLMKLQTTVMTYLYQNHYKLMEYKELKDKDISAHTSIFCNFDRIASLKKIIFGLKVEWKQLNEKLIYDLKGRKIKQLQKYVEIQKSNESALKNDKLQIKKLSHEAEKTIKHLQSVLKKGERILLMMKLCFIYRNPREKVMHTQQDSNIMPLEKTQLFWNNVGKVDSMLPELKNKILELLVEQSTLKSSLNNLVQKFFKSL